MEHLIELKDVYKIYQMGEETVHALDGISLTVDPGEFVAIVGSSGSGKSTAMNIIGCLDVPTSGTYHLGGVDVSTMDDDQQAEIRNKMLGFIFQQYNLIPKLNVLENVELPLLYAGVSAAERHERAIRSLERVGLADKCKNLPSQLSGGQQQRVSIARALAGMPGATIAPDKTVLDLDVDAFRKVVDLNLFGTVLPTMVFVDVMAKNKKGAIVNFCSESALRPLTRVVGYGSAKAAIGNYTRYMATELATKFSPELRVNAIVPGFLLTNQNRALLTNPDGSYTDRAKTIIAHTPCGRFAEPEELFGTIHYLISDASSFVTGALSVVDGGFDAFSI